MPRTTAWRIYTDYCNPVSTGEAKAGDIIFFKNTYNSGSPISHVGIYAGNGMMIHAGIQFNILLLTHHIGENIFMGLEDQDRRIQFEKRTDSSKK